MYVSDVITIENNISQLKEINLNRVSKKDHVEDHTICPTGAERGNKGINKI